MDIRLNDKDALSAFDRFFIKDSYSFCLSDKRLKSVYTEHIEKTPKLNWCQLKFNNCNSKSYDIRVSQQSTKMFTKELNKFQFKTLKEIASDLGLEHKSSKKNIKKQIARLRIDHILMGKPIISIHKM